MIIVAHFFVQVDAILEAQKGHALLMSHAFNFGENLIQFPEGKGAFLPQPKKNRLR